MKKVRQGTKSILNMFMTLTVSTLVMGGRVGTAGEKLLEFLGEAPGFRNYLITNQHV